MGGNALAHGLHHLEVDAQQIITAHAGFAGHTSGNDTDVSACNISIILRAGQGRIEFGRGARFSDIERFAFRRALCDVEQNDVAQLFQCCKMRKCAADLPRADKRDFGSGHSGISDRVALVRG